MPVYEKKGRDKTTKRVVIWWQGKRHELVVEGTKAEAVKFEARKRVELEAAGKAPETRTVPTFSAFCRDRYAAHAKKHLRDSTWTVRRYQLATLSVFFGDHKLTECTTDEVERFKTERADKYEAAHGEPLKNSTINTELTKLQAVLTYARKLGIPCAKPDIILLPETGTRRVHVWTEAQVQMIFTACERLAPDLLPIVVFLANTGCRPGEALAAPKTWVRLDSGHIRIEPNEFWQPKDNEPREVPISDALLPWLRRANDTPWLFPNRDGERWATWPDATFNRVRDAAGHADECGLWIRPAAGPKKGKHDAAILAHVAEHPSHAAEQIGAALGLKTDVVKVALYRLLKLGRLTLERKGRGAVRTVVPAAEERELGCTCGRPGLRGGPYTLRHTFASNFLKNRPDMFLLAQVMGHDHTRVTALYAHLLPDHLAGARNAVNFAPGVGPARLEAKARWAAAASR